MKRRLNLRLLLWTVGCFTALAVGVSVLHGHQVRKNAHVVLQRGEDALSKQELPQAVYYLGQYLALEPGDVDAFEKHVLTLDKLARDPSDRIRIVLRIEDLLMRDAKRDVARERLIHNLVALYRYRDAVVHLKVLLPQRPNDAALHQLLGQCHAAVGESAAATAVLTRTIELEPGRIAAYLLLADIYERALNQDEEAVQAIDKMVAANPKNQEAYLARSRFAQRRGQLTEAATDIQQAVALAPNDAAVLLAAATWAESQSRWDDARRHLRRGIELHPGHVGSIKTLANLELRDGRRVEAVRILKDGILQAPAAFELHILLADLLIDAKQYDEAARLIDVMERAGLSPTFPNYLKARLAFERQQWREAIALLDKAGVILGAHTEWSSRIHALRGACYEKVGDTSQRLAAWQKAVQSEPGWTAAKYGLGTTLLALGRIEDAAAELEYVSKAADAPPQIWTALAGTHLQLQLRRPEIRRDWTNVEQYLARAATADAGDVQVPLLRAEMLAARGSLAEARKQLATIDGAKHVAPWTALAELELRQGRTDAALKILDDATTTFGNHVELRLARIRALSARGSDEDRAALHLLAEKLDGYPSDAQIRVLRLLAESWRMLGERAATEHLWRRIAEVLPADVDSRFLLLESTLQRGDAAQARELVAAVRKLEGEQGVLWRWGDAALKIQEANGAAGKLAAVRAEIVELGKQQRDWPRIPLLEARIDEIEGKWESVIDNCIRAVELGERQPRFTRRLVQLLLERRLYQQAERVLMLCEESAPLSDDLARQAALAAAANQNAARVRQLIAQLFPSQPRDYRDLIWLADLHVRIDESTKAEALLRRAVEKSPSVPEVWISLAEHLARTGQHAAAEAMIAQMQKTMPKQRLPLTLARCWDAAGKGVRAAAAYAEALAAAPHDFLLLQASADFNWRADHFENAAALYERLLAPQTSAPADVAAQARRRLVQCRIGSGNLTRAAALLDEYRHSFAEEPADRRLRWFIDGQDETRRRQAIQQMRDSFRRDPSTLEEDIMLVRLVEASGDVAQARERMVQALSIDESPQRIAQHIRLLLRAEVTDEALLWYAKLERWEPAAPRTLELKQLLLSEKQKG